MMWKDRKLIRARDPDTLQKFDFALVDYKADHWYWECVELFRKLILSGLISVFERGSIAQTVLATLASFVFFALSFHAQPFNTARMNALKICSEFQIFGILLTCVVLQSNRKGDQIATELITIDDYGSVQVVLTIAIVPITMYMLALGVRDLRAQGMGIEQKNEENNAPGVEVSNPVGATENLASFENEDTAN
jgi:hypothetical protein